MASQNRKTIHLTPPRMPVRVQECMPEWTPQPLPETGKEDALAEGQEGGQEEGRKPPLQGMPEAALPQAMPEAALPTVDEPSSRVEAPDVDDPFAAGPPICQADATEVVKRLKPGQAGTRSLHRRYGPALVCVRYRKDSAAGNTRFTTVELVVDHGPPRRQPMIRVAIDDTETSRQALALGAQWDAAQKTWRMPRHAAIRLGLVRNGRKVIK